VRLSDVANGFQRATLLYENNRAMAEREFERALELRPSYVLGRSWYALFYLQWACGEYERGIAEARRALDIDPLSAYVTFLLGLCLCRRAWDEREPTFILHARHFPEFRTMHSDPRFATILNEMNEPC
jgi:tetratricopeptide (TPR) repeat protein